MEQSEFLLLPCQLCITRSTGTNHTQSRKRANDPLGAEQLKKQAPQSAVSARSAAADVAVMDRPGKGFTALPVKCWALQSGGGSLEGWLIPLNPSSSSPSGSLWLTSWGFFLLFVEFPSETKEGFPSTADRQWQHQLRAPWSPYQTHNLKKYKLTICRLEVVFEKPFQTSARCLNCRSIFAR